MKYVSEQYKQQLDHLAEVLVFPRTQQSEDEQVQASIDRTREACIAEEEERLGRFAGHLSLVPPAEYPDIVA